MPRQARIRTRNITLPQSIDAQMLGYRRHDPLPLRFMTAQPICCAEPAEPQPKSSQSAGDRMRPMMRRPIDLLGQRRENGEVPSGSASRNSISAGAAHDGSNIWTAGKAACTSGTSDLNGIHCPARASAEIPLRRGHGFSAARSAMATNWKMGSLMGISNVCRPFPLAQTRTNIEGARVLLTGTVARLATSLK